METMKGATIILIFWICLLLVLIILMIKSWIEREDCEDYDKLRGKFRGISGQPELCRAIYFSFQTQQNNLAAIINKAEQSEEVEECPTCIQIEEGSTLPYSDLTCPQCGRRVREVTESRL